MKFIQQYTFLHKLHNHLTDGALDIAGDGNKFGVCRVIKKGLQD